MIDSKLQLTRLTDLDGKTIKPDGAVTSSEYLALQFIDNSFVIFKGYSIEQSDYLEIVNESVEICGFLPYELYELGLINESEYEQLNKERERKEREAEEQHERETLERLLRKYGKG